jgi:hypothetical protein
MATSSPAPDPTALEPADRVQRVDGLLQTVCCEASIVMDSGSRSICGECGDVISADLGETLDLLGVGE